MGIRFLCGHCQGRLNVKQRLAGEYCFCHACSEEVLVPLTSTIAEPKPRPKRTKRNAQREEYGSADSGKETATLQRPDRMSEISDAYSLGIGSDRIVAETAESVRAVKAEDQRLAGVEAAFLSAETVDKNRSEINNLAEQQDADLESRDKLGAKNKEEASSRSFLLSKPVAKIEDDPLKSNPQLIWYFRHRSLGEKGPLKAHQVETMLETGQLQAGAILWREDWNDWLPAEKVFPQIVEKTSPSSYEIPDELNPHSEANRKRRAQKRFWMVFNIAAFLLIIVLVYWLCQVIS